MSVTKPVFDQQSNHRVVAFLLLKSGFEIVGLLDSAYRLEHNSNGAQFVDPVTHGSCASVHVRHCAHSVLVDGGTLMLRPMSYGTVHGCNLTVYANDILAVTLADPGVALNLLRVFGIVAESDSHQETGVKQ